MRAEDVEVGRHGLLLRADGRSGVLLPQVAGMLVYMLMAAVLLWKPEGLFKQ